MLTVVRILTVADWHLATNHIIHRARYADGHSRLINYGWPPYPRTVLLTYRGTTHILKKIVLADDLLAGRVVLLYSSTLGSTGLGVE